MFIQTEPTPNPATLKFLPGKPVLDAGTLDMPTRAAAAQSPLAEKLFDIPNVGGVMFGSDFISVTQNGGDWQQMKPAILGAIMEHYMSGAPLVAAGSDANAETGDEFFDIPDLSDALQPRQTITVVARKAEGGGGKADSHSPLLAPRSFAMRVRIDTPVELDYYKNGGILQTVLRKLMRD